MQCCGRHSKNRYDVITRLWVERFGQILVGCCSVLCRWWREDNRSWIKRLNWAGWSSSSVTAPGIFSWEGYSPGDLSEAPVGSLGLVSQKLKQFVDIVYIYDKLYWLRKRSKFWNFEQFTSRLVGLCFTVGGGLSDVWG